MGNFYGDNSLIVIRPARLSEIREGMLVVYKNDGNELIAHQVVRHCGNALQTKGHSNTAIDPSPVTENMLLGVIFCVFHANRAPSDEVLSSNGNPLPIAHCRSF